jgi:hypothetical protein
VAPEDTAVDVVETAAGRSGGGAAHMGSGRRWLNRASGGLVGQALRLEEGGLGRRVASRGGGWWKPKAGTGARTRIAG